jgi:hypothetical protein
MAIDESGIQELILEGQDLHLDELRRAEAARSDLAELRDDRADRAADPCEMVSFDGSRRRLLGHLGTLGGVALLGGGIGAAMTSILARPAAADQALDVQILQTASSLERLAVNTYGAALQLSFIKGTYPLVVKLAQVTMSQHDAHRAAFQAQTAALGGKVQDAPNPKYAPIVASAMPTWKTPLDMVKVAILLETVARDTYLSDLAQMSDGQSKKILASVMGVEAQHLATLRALASLLELGVPALIAIPVATQSLSAAFGRVGFPDGPFPAPTMASPPAEGALR